MECRAAAAWQQSAREEARRKKNWIGHGPVTSGPTRRCSVKPIVPRERFNGDRAPHRNCHVAFIAQRWVTCSLKFSYTVWHWDATLGIKGRTAHILYSKEHYTKVYYFMYILFSEYYVKVLNATSYYISM